MTDRRRGQLKLLSLPPPHLSLIRSFRNESKQHISILKRFRIKEPTGQLILKRFSIKEPRRQLILKCFSIREPTGQLILWLIHSGMSTCFQTKLYFFYFSNKKSKNCFYFLKQKMKIVFWIFGQNLRCLSTCYEVKSLWFCETKQLLLKTFLLNIFYMIKWDLDD